MGHGVFLLNTNGRFLPASPHAAFGRCLPTCLAAFSPVTSHR